MEDPGFVQLAGDVVEDVAVTGDGHRGRTVDRGDRHPPAELVARLLVDRAASAIRRRDRRRACGPVRWCAAAAGCGGRSPRSACSKVSSPARWWAATSPALWPITASGRDAELFRVARPERPGWRSWPAARTPSRPCGNRSRRAGVPRAATSPRGGTARDRCAAMLSVKAGKTSSRPRHIFHHWGPMPVQTNASFGAVGACAAGGDLPAVGEGLELVSRVGDAVGDQGVAMVEVGASLAECVAEVRAG